MTFDEVMKKYNGEWVDGKAVIRTDYFWTIAVGSPDKFTLTTEGKRYVTDEAPAEPAPKKRTRKVADE